MIENVDTSFNYNRKIFTIIFCVLISIREIIVDLTVKTALFSEGNSDIYHVF